MLELVIDQRRRDLGGFEVGRVLPFHKRRMVGPFVFLDHMGPVSFPPGIPRTVDVRPHPHIGLSTVTYLFDGEIMHRDSLGSEQAIVPGDVNWMTAGRGITHSERFERARAEGGNVHGVQAWVALPAELEESDPAFFHHPRAALPVSEEPGVRMRLVAGAAFGVQAPVRSHSPLFYVHWQFDANREVTLPAEYAELAVFVVSGAIEHGAHEYRPGQLLVFRGGSEVRLRAVAPSVLMALGGEPLGPRFIEWNFVSSSKARIEQAKAAWRSRQFKLPDRDPLEFIPLPPDPKEPAPPLS